MIRFVFLAEPTAGAEHADDLAGAKVEVWVNDDNREYAEAKARAYIMDCSWVVKELKIVDPWPGELCPDQDTQAAEFALHAKAERNGIAGLFRAYPKVPRPGVFEYRPLCEPLTPDGKQ